MIDLIAQARGERNNNILNIRHNKDKFQGERPIQTDPAFKQFVNNIYGYRAAFLIFGTYLTRGLNTIEKIINEWAPPEDRNDTERYIRNVSARSRVPRNKILNNKSGADYIEIAIAMAFSECSVIANRMEVEQGFMLQTKIKK